jgi:hypothetical protein
MQNIWDTHPNFQIISNFHDLVNTPFQGQVNAMCWQRSMQGNFEEIVHQFRFEENILEVSEEALLALDLSLQGQLARNIILEDLALLKAHGAMPSLNVIKYYEPDEENPIFPTDVYSFHVDSAPIPGSTFLCTYVGAPSEILPNAEAEKKLLLPSFRAAIEKQNDKGIDNIDIYIKEHFYDLHYQAKAGAKPIILGIGHLWRLAIEHPQSEVLPCIHRAPKENPGELRLLLIC